MAARTYTVYNGANPTTAALTKVATGTAIKTLLQINPANAQPMLRVIEWGISFDAVAATPIQCELIETDVAATVTAYVAADIMPQNDPNAKASSIQIASTTKSGFTSTSEGSTTVTRVGDYQLVAQQYVKQFPLGREFEVTPNKFLRIRVTAAVTNNAVCYLTYEE